MVFTFERFDQEIQCFGVVFSQSCHVTNLPTYRELRTLLRVLKLKERNHIDPVRFMFILQHQYRKKT